MPHTCDFGDAEVQGEHVDNGLAAAGHHTGSPAGVGIRTDFFEDVLYDDERAAAGDRAQQHQRQKLYGDVQQPEKRIQQLIKKSDQAGGGQAVDCQINADQKREDLHCGLETLFCAVDEIVVDRRVVKQSVREDDRSHDRDKRSGERFKKSFKIHELRISFP